MPRRNAPGGATRARLPLVLTSDDALLDDLLRLAEAGGAEVEVAADPMAAQGRYPVAPLVLLGVDQAGACLRARLPRRSDIVLVGRPDDVASVWEHAELIGAAYVAILPAAEPWLVKRIAAAGRGGSAAARVVAVLGGRGGAGASVLAAGLALTAAHGGHKVLLVDADPLGGGLDLVLGWEDRQGLRWPELVDGGGLVDLPALVGAPAGSGDLVLLSFDRRDLPAAPPELMAAVLGAGRHRRDLVVVDLPRRLDGAAVVALQAADRGLVVVPAELRATTAAAKVVAEASRHCAHLGLVVRGPSPGHLTAPQISRSLQLPLVGTLRPELRLPGALENGAALTGGGRRGPLAVLCQRLVTELCGPQPAVAA